MFCYSPLAINSALSEYALGNFSASTHQRPSLECQTQPGALAKGERVLCRSRIRISVAALHDPKLAGSHFELLLELAKKVWRAGVTQVCCDVFYGKSGAGELLDCRAHAHALAVFADTEADFLPEQARKVGGADSRINVLAQAFQPCSKLAIMLVNEILRLRNAPVCAWLQVWDTRYPLFNARCRPRKYLCLVISSWYQSNS